tara:strand:+ start:299 stop:565 length:267 start_codon:yes stop_codon:yes gene_type:complete
MVRTNRTATSNQIVARSMGHNFVNVEFKSEQDEFTAIVFQYYSTTVVSSYCSFDNTNIEQQQQQQQQQRSENETKDYTTSKSFSWTYK